jgi:LSD1 subclass zinc finger protein
VQPRLSIVSHTGLSDGAPDSVRCARLVSGELVTLGKSSAVYGYNSPDCPVVHRTVRWANGCQRNDRPPNPRVTRGPLQRSTRGHRTVRCANCHKVAMVGCARNGRKSRTRHEQWLSGGAPDCPVRHPTEGNFGLPRMPLTAPSCLGAIKGTPRRMEEQTQAFIDHS